MSCCSDFFLHNSEHHGSGRAGDKPPSAWLAGLVALLPPYILVYGCTRRFAGWAERSEVQHVRAMTLGFTRTAFGFSLTCTGAAP